MFKRESLNTWAKSGASRFNAMLRAFLCVLTLSVALLGCRRVWPPVVTFKHDSEAMAEVNAMQEAHNSGGYVSYTTGISMEPAIITPCYSVVIPTPWESLQEGDIAIYLPKWHSGMVIHRCVQKDSGGWIMSGDNNARSESWERMTKDNYFGKLQSVHKW